MTKKSIKSSLISCFLETSAINSCVAVGDKHDQRVLYVRRFPPQGYITRFSLCRQMSDPPLSPELVYHQIKLLLAQRKVLRAYNLWEESVNQNSNGWGGLPNYNETTGRMRLERSLLKAVFDDVRSKKPWTVLEKYENHSDFLSVEYSHLSSPEHTKIRADFSGGELNVIEMATIMRDMAILPRIGSIFSVRSLDLYPEHYTTSGLIKLNSYYPGLWGAQEGRVFCNFFDCKDEEGAIAVCYTWETTEQKKLAKAENTDSICFLFYPQKQKMTVCVTVRKNKNTFKCSSHWMDRNFICYNLHNTITCLLDLSRRMVLLDPDLIETTNRMWRKIDMYQNDEATAFHHDKFDSDFYHWIHAAMKTE